MDEIWSVCMTVVAGIAFTLITVRVELGWGHESSPGPTSRYNSDIATWSQSARSQSDLHGTPNSVPLRIFSVNVRETVEQEVDFVIPQRKIRKEASDSSNIEEVRTTMHT